MTTNTRPRKGWSPPKGWRKPTNRQTQEALKTLGRALAYEMCREAGGPGPVLAGPLSSATVTGFVRERAAINIEAWVDLELAQLRAREEDKGEE